VSRETPLPSLSVVIPIGDIENKSKNFARILKMDLTKVELIIVLDTPNAANRSRVKELLKRSNAVSTTLLEGVFGNPGDARNFGIQKATAHWITFWDVDDFPELDAILNALMHEEQNLDVIVGQFRVRNWHDGSMFGEPSKDFVLSSIAFNPGLWRHIFRLELVKNLRFPSINMAEDQYFLALVYEKATKVFFSEDIFYNYFKNVPRQLTGSKENLVNLKTSINSMLDLRSKLKNEKAREALDVMLIRQIFTSAKKNGIRQPWLWSLGVQIARVVDTTKLSTVLFQILSNQVKNLTNKNTRDVHVKKRLVVVLNGGLGNQLFQLAFALDKSITYEVSINTMIGKTRPGGGENPEILNFEIPHEIQIDETQIHIVARKLIGLLIRIRLNRFESRSMGSIGDAFFRLLKKLFEKTSKVFDEIYVANETGKTEIELSAGNQLVVGYFQTFEWDNPVRVENFLSKMTPKFAADPVAQYAIKSIREKPLVMHIRLGDYTSEPNFGVISRKYLEDALSEAFKSYNFLKIWLFSDDPDKALGMLPEEYLSKIEVIPEIANSATLTLEVMRLGHGYILSNSTYSWWAAFLSKQKPAVVTVPQPWFVNLPEPRSMVPNSWTRIVR
jgi:hypothetical protein